MIERLIGYTGLAAAIGSAAEVINTQTVNPFVVVTMGTALAITGFWATHKSKLAATIATQHDNLIDLLTGERDAWKARCERDEVERKESDAHHQKIIDEYRTSLHAVRGELQDCSFKTGEMKAVVADLKARTDFEPIREFLQNSETENRKSRVEQTNVLTALTTAMMELTFSVRASDKSAQESAKRADHNAEHPPQGTTIVKNTPEDAVPMKPVT